MATSGKREAGRRGGEDRSEERAHTLFKMLVEQYLKDGAPVPSKTLASHVEVSSATVRNVMAELELRGLVRSPHTSAGKVPTNRGLRFFVDSFVSVRPLDGKNLQRLRAALHPDRAPEELAAAASRLLSHITKMAGVVSLPKPERVALRQVEFLRLSGNRALAILVVNEREVQNRVIHTDRDYSEAELNQAANFLNERYSGKPLAEIRGQLVEDMEADKERLDRLMQTALDVARKAFAADDAEPERYVVSGAPNLADVLPDPAAMRELFDEFARKGAIVHLLDRCLESDGIQVFIGEESGYRMFDACAVVTAPYAVNSEVAGALGVVGPTRMAYQRVIPMVDVTARLLGAAMSMGRA